MKSSIRLVLVAGVLASGLAAGLLIAGPLNPPGGAVSGNTAASVLSTTDPWANFAY